MIKLLASIYDPLGVLNPIVVTFKVFFQKLCLSKLGWDEHLDGDLLKEWNVIIDGLSDASDICVPRIYADMSRDVDCVELHGFADASVKAYGCCIYMRVKYVDGSVVSCLVCAKSRVAPIKKMTVPRLELCGAVLLSKLMANVYSCFASCIELLKVFCWVDSSIALSWINAESKVFVPFVQRRVEKCRDLSDARKCVGWFHVRSEDNPADIVSRGVLGCEIVNNDFWFKGPEFLLNSNIDLNGHNVDITNDEFLTSFTNNEVITGESFDMQLVFDVGKYESFEKLVRITAYVNRFIGNIDIKKREKITSNILIPSELIKARMMWFEYIQRRDEKGNRNFKQLASDLRFEKVNNVIRCMGRLENAPLPYETKHPIYIPKESKIAELLVLQYHKLALHGGVKDTLNLLRSKYWIPKARNMIRSLIHRCTICRRYEGKSYSYPQSPALPEYRLYGEFAFKNIGVDYAGPLHVRNIYGNDKQMYKAWIVIITCASTRAICLDLVPDCSAATFILSFKRFISRRGVPSLVISDNGTQFASEQTQLFTLTKGIKWKFNLPLAPWWGGIFERMVRTTKRCLKKVLGNARINFDEMLTLLFEIEMVINNRPLTFIYEDPGSVPLTPNHLLFGRNLNIQASDCDNENNEVIEIDLHKRHKAVSFILNCYIKRWKHEYLTELREFHKSKKGASEPLISVGDVVIIHDENKVRSLWPVGIVENIIPSNDGAIRGVSVRHITESGRSNVIKRPVNKLYPLECIKASTQENNLDSCINIKFINEDDIELVKTIQHPGGGC